MSAFSDHIALFRYFLDRRRAIVDTIEVTLLNVRGKEITRIRDRAYFEHRLNTCFFGVPGLSRDLVRLKGQLAAMHLADGFEPVRLDRYTHELDPLELIVRAYQHWDEHRWPGSSGRLALAQNVYAVFMLRHLERLSSRIWDDGRDRAAEHLHEIQRLLDDLNGAAAPGAFVRDARWLIQTALGPLTRHLRPYFTVADHVSGSFTDSTRLGVHAAGAKLAGGHLRSQLRYRSWSTGQPTDHPENLAITRNSNSMDTALLVRDLVPLLAAYERACETGNRVERRDLADAILQGVSADPEILLTRLDLLTPCTMVEDLFIARGDDGHAGYTALGATQVQQLETYGQLIGRLASPLIEDAKTIDPTDKQYSPLGITYGFCADILSNMATGAILSQPTFGLSLEDMFVSHGSLDEKRSRAHAWKTLPRREGEREHFDHSTEFASETFARVMRALESRARQPHASNASAFADARLFVVPESKSVASWAGEALPGNIVRTEEYCVSSDTVRSDSGTAVARSQDDMLLDRQEGRFLASAGADGAWFGVSKILLTFATSQGKDALITGAPQAVVEAIKLTCPGLVITPDGVSVHVKGIEGLEDVEK